MKKFWFLTALLGIEVCAVWAQTYPSAAEQDEVIAEAPASSVDLLRQSMDKSGSSLRPAASSADDLSAGAPTLQSPAANPAPEATRSSISVKAPANLTATRTAVPVEEPAKKAGPTPVKKLSEAEKEKNAKDMKNFLDTTLGDAAQAAAASGLDTPQIQWKEITLQLPSGKTMKTRVPAEQLPSQFHAVDPSVPVPVSALATPLEQDIEKQNALLGNNKPAEKEPAISPAKQAELDYAARVLQQAKEEQNAGRFIPQAASKTAQQTAPVVRSTGTVVKRKIFNPNEFRPNVEWQRSNSTHFVIYTQKREGGIGSSNMNMIFETAYATLRRNIPWMMSDKVRVFVYQDHESYLQHEPNAKAWTRALAYPTRGEIVVYDEPGKQQELKEVFTHELVHIFTQKFFDPKKTGQLMTPTWLDEGLAVYMEDQAYNGSQGGPWSGDLKTLAIERSPQTAQAQFSSSNMFGSRPPQFGQRTKKQGPPVVFMPFDQFMQEGSLDAMEAKNKEQDWYLQAYTMVRFLLNPSGGTSPSNRMQFEQFTRLMAQGEPVRDPRTGFQVRDAQGQLVYRPYSAEKAMGQAFRYGSAANFEDNFWRWFNNQFK